MLFIVDILPAKTEYLPFKDQEAKLKLVLLLLSILPTIVIMNLKYV
jgi:hypothetical protein